MEWVLGKRESSPAGELGRAGRDSQKIAESLADAVEKAASTAKRATIPAAARRK